MHNKTDPIEHSIATETLIIFSQSLLFIFLFVMLKIGLIDRRGMMADREAASENILQIVAIFFAILVFVMLVMLPMHTYEYAHYVASLSFIVIFIILFYDCRFAYNTNPSTKQRRARKQSDKREERTKLVTSISRTTESENGFDF
jgi:uncharacterized membrane protein